MPTSVPLEAPVRLSGFVPPLCTPFTPGGDVDTGSLRRLVEHLLAGGASALFALGTSGEAAHLTAGQRRTVVRTVVEAAGGRVPVLAGVIDMTTPRVLEHARDAAEAGADVLVATAPFYSGVHPEETAGHFRCVRGGGGLPLLAYDIPSSVHSKLPGEVLLSLASEGTLVGLKDSSGDTNALRRLLVERRLRGLESSFSVLTGSELTVDAALLMGADGVVAGLGNVDPAGYARVCALSRAGDWKAAVAEQDRLAALFALVEAGSGISWTASAIGGFKVALRLLGVIDCAATAPPLGALGEEGVRVVRELLVEAGLL
ncbi:dihydrodipicolinate synthase family protein [Streptomyces sp. AV19]|uniref:dihydrodipicolinate synthase family protein n=1 Tax=Streptomyces sp. AV19 TaxID=2793068 RepID=UPI0018FE68F7|nr:dihydrodipicolinate synthase family protein [Streptomyces sp. AV19]MBH1938209.1 dihydrodipicolinate synthase family protein [Streptomyces sp. AV19]MDG4534848.1 dihydrodipicolinate synthase family protein [Streptomyces sp. AV19]